MIPKFPSPIYIYTYAENLDVATLKYLQQRCSFGRFRPRDHDGGDRARFPVLAALHFIKIRWMWTHVWRLFGLRILFKAAKSGSRLGVSTSIRSLLLVYYYDTIILPLMQLIKQHFRVIVESTLRTWTPTQVSQHFELVWNKSNCIGCW
jgi:hypothetical protein